jgi:ABC-type xylose transport system permease subunit
MAMTSRRLTSIFFSATLLMMVVQSGMRLFHLDTPARDLVLGAVWLGVAVVLFVLLLRQWFMERRDGRNP